MTRPEHEGVEPVGAATESVLLVVGQVHDAVSGPDLVALLVLPRQAGPAEDVDELLGGAVRVWGSREPLRIDAHAVDAETDGSGDVAEPLPARGHLADLAAPQVDVVPVREHRADYARWDFRPLGLGLLRRPRRRARGARSAHAA